MQVVAFGLGLTVLLLLTFVRTDLLEGWRQTLDENAPNNFLINIQPQERASITEIFQSAGIAAPTFVPMVRARMQTINDEDVKTREYPDEGGKWMANREQNLTWAETLSASNEVVKGEWWPADYDGEPLLSIEEDAAIELGVVALEAIIIPQLADEPTVEAVILMPIVVKIVPPRNSKPARHS